MAKLFIPSLLLLLTLSAYSQNTGIGTSSPAFKLDVRNGSINTDSLYRIGGAAVVSVKGTDNTLIGIGPHNSPSVGAFNTAVGAKALASNNNSVSNTAIGVEALNQNTTGGGNTAIGIRSLAKNLTAVENTAIGLHSLYFNNYGNYNTAMGVYALSSNSGSSHNTALGAHALDDVDRSYNTGIGSWALSSTDYSEYNTAVGYRAGDYYDHGYNNVFVGANTNTNGDGYYNVIAIGQGTLVGASSRAVFGNPATNFYGGWASWTSFSDGRFKTNIKEDVAGIDFIKKLRPVTYTVKATELDAFLHKGTRDELSEQGKAVHAKALREKEAFTYTGFIAQEVEEAARQTGFNFSGVHSPANEADSYGLRYAEFVVPLVKAVQEQQVLIEKQAKVIEDVKKENVELKVRMEKLERRLMK